MAQTRGPIFVLALVAAILGGAGLAYFLDREESRAPRTSERPALDSTSPLQPPAAPESDSPAATPTRTAADSATTTLPTSAASLLPCADLLGHVLDSSRRPLAGARVTLTRSEAATFTVLDLEPGHASLPLAEALSDSSGAFRFTLPIGMQVDVGAALSGYCDAFQPAAYAGQELELVLTPGVLVYGRVTRKKDGAPIGDARVRVFRLGAPSSQTRETTTRADGSYELRFSFREGATIEIVPKIQQCSEWTELTIGPDDRCEHDVALDDGLAVVGRVTAADTGLAIAGATVGEGWWFRRSTTTDARGEYRLEGFGDPGVRELSARAPGFSGTRTENLPPAVDGVLHVDFTLEPARAVHGRVLDEHGAPVAEAYVAAVASEFGPEGQRTDWLAARTDAAGRYRIGDLAKDLGHALLVSKQGFATQVYDFPELELATQELELGDVVLRAPGLIAGRVEDGEGKAIAGVEIELGGANADRARFTAEQRPLGRAEYYVDTRSARSDAQGRFWFGDVAAGSYRLVTRREGRPESAPLTIELGPGERRADLVVRLTTGAGIHGEIVGDKGEPLAGVYVSVQVERLLDPKATPPGHVSQRTAADGRFELAGLPEGEYTLRAYPLEAPAVSPDEPWLPATLEHVHTGAQSLVVRMPRGASIRGRLLDAQGSPLVGYVVASVTAPGEIEETALTDADGRFALNVLPASTWNLEVRGAPQTEGFNRVLLTRPAVAAGTHDLELRLAP